MIQDWVLEMWGYAIAAASVGVHHDVRQLQIEPGASAHLAADFASKYYIFHYTYGIEYKMDGTPQGVNQIGVWSLDKRHYGGSYPPLELDPPPPGASVTTNYLWRAWMEAMHRERQWPATNAMGTIGWRREGKRTTERPSHPRKPLQSPPHLHHP